MTLWAMQAASSGAGVVGDGTLCRVPTWVKSLENNVILKETV